MLVFPPCMHEGANVPTLLPTARGSVLFICCGLSGVRYFLLRTYSLLLDVDRFGGESKGSPDILLVCSGYIKIEMP